MKLYHSSVSSLRQNQPFVLPNTCHQKPFSRENHKTNATTSSRACKLLVALRQMPCSKKARIVCFSSASQAQKRRQRRRCLVLCRACGLKQPPPAPSEGLFAACGCHRIHCVACGCHRIHRAVRGWMRDPQQLPQGARIFTSHRGRAIQHRTNKASFYLHDLVKRCHPKTLRSDRTPQRQKHERSHFGSRRRHSSSLRQP